MTVPMHLAHSGHVELPQPDDRAQPVECPCLALGMAVLFRAWIDALDNTPTREGGMRPRLWWTARSRGLRYWCEALGLDLSWVVTRAQRRLHEYDAGDIATKRRIRGQVEYSDRDADDYVSTHDWHDQDPVRHNESCRLYYVTHREDILARRKLRRAQRAAKADRMEDRFPGYSSRHPRNTDPSQAES